eukprot:TRINITY_DN5358_c1_g2_i2.p1 TRINITY_DN5358_c1_g2~~TRINITY_DN5358_c1_g2_i2.p1  ORF type:complete len:204 (-),score=57.55 TRINITY_DN5358_c1_g2_i2:1124-1735(-)
MLLYPGQVLTGTQSVKSENTWSVRVTIQKYAPEQGYVCGSMEARHLPEQHDKVTTFWEGDVVTSLEHFWTSRWCASRKSDLAHWGKFAPFRAIHPGHGTHSSSSSSTAASSASASASSPRSDSDAERALRTSRHVFMRWKERFFITRESESRITIAGFYYVCLDLETGAVDGYYFDPLSPPNQRLRLAPPTDAPVCFSTAQGY